MAPQEEKKWIECSCTDADHAIRLIYYPDDGYGDNFYIDYKTCPWPEIGFFYADIFKNIKSYVKNVWWAIKGKPSYYMSQWTAEPKQAKQLANFINRHYRPQKHIFG